MQSLNKERLFWWVTVPALVAVLATLAVLQFRWSEQVSVATREQMQSNLQTSLMGFRQDLGREVGAVAVELRSAAPDPANLRASDFSRQFRHWQATAVHPGLVEQVFVWERSPQDELMRLDSGRDQFEPRAWPASFEKLHQHLLAAPLVVNRGSGLHQHSAGQRQHGAHRNPGNFVPWMVAQDIPAIVYPVLQRNADASQPPSVSSWIIVQLNPVVLQKEVFPELAQKYFRGTSGLDYRVAVLGPRESLLYATDNGFNAQGSGPPDAQVNLFGPPFRRADGAQPGLMAYFPQLKGGGAGRPPAADDKRGSGMERPVRLEPFPYSVEDGYWQVAVKHQRGSVEAAVSGLHRRNLMISFGVLVLLALTMALVVIASHRTRRLASLQMDFVAGVSHELRTPLAVISSAAENIAHGVVSDQQQLARYGASILKQARQLNQLVEQVLVFAATQQKHGNYQLSAVNVANVIETALENTSALAGTASITIERKVEPGLPPAAADFGALAQCLQNLITNAIKYGDGQWIGIHAAAHKVDGKVREIELSVEDRGIGISPQEIKHIFEPFYRSPSVAGSSVHGTGLGLPLARTVIEAMRGRLTVKSEPGKGSSFTIHLAVMSGARLAETAPGSIPGETAGYYS
ncbi:MAG TPA: HAMP domain-containing sensor histidine kinase [Candidatus Angelobacter sp.]|nr:HAMP domain-containing sensor histidine kinase [Candidatus Angelobacter sp.]